MIRKAGNLRAMLLEAPSLYKMQSDAELQSQADAQYAGEAASAKNIAQNQYNAQETAIKNQIASLDKPYQDQVAEAKTSTQQNVDAANASAMSRGLGRSGIQMALQNNAQVAGTNAVSKIMADKGQQVSNLNNQIGTLGSNLATTMSTIDQSKDSAIKAAFSTLKENNLANYTNNANDRTTFLFNLLNQVKKNSSSHRTSTSHHSSSSSKTPAKPTTNTDFLSSVIGAIAGAAGSSSTWN
jgi:hypothetical protein